MLPKQEVVAMLLAGGQGSRLGVLKKTCQAGGSLWRKIPYYRFPTV